jgi:hypothetical protein
MFDRTIEALRARGKNEWDIADALLAEVTPSRVGISNQTMGTWEELAAVLAEEGIEYSTSTLRQYRDTAAKWATDDRVEGVSFTAHRYATRANNPRELILRLKESKGKATTEDVRSATQTGKKASVRSKITSARKLTEMLSEINKTWAREIASTPEGRAELESFARQLGKTNALVHEWLDSPTASKMQAKQQKQAQQQSATPKAAPTAKKGAAKKGRRRGQ